MDYLEWNNAIGAHFFNPDKSGKRIFLYVTKDVLNGLGESRNADFNAFKAAVKLGPPWITRHGQSICQQALQAFDDWRDRKTEYPPYLGYLALFVLADIINVGFARHAYYPGLRSLLGEHPESGMYPSFNRMHHLWDDLALWSNQDRNGEWGVFDADIVGEWMHVGFPRAQTLLTDEERENLPCLFADNGFDPLSLPSDQEISYLLANDPHNRLRSHSKELLRSTAKQNSTIRTALIEAFLEELQNWDGSIPPQPESDVHIRHSLGNLRLTMILDPTARTVRLSLRCRSNREYPEEGLHLTRQESQESLYCAGDWQGWSTPLYLDENQTKILDASTLDWQDGLSLLDQEHAWKIALSKRTVRVMISAKPFGFDGFVENNQIPEGKPFYLIVHDVHASKIQTWGTQSCDDFSRIEVLSGLPSGWTLYSIRQANSDVLIRDTFPFLALSSVVRIHFRGGLKARGNQYFTFALPQVEVTGTTESTHVYCNDHRLIPDQDSRLYSIPDVLRAQRFIIEVRQNGEPLCKKTLYALETHPLPHDLPTISLDKFGQRVSNDAEERCIGPMVFGFSPPEFNAAVFLPPSKGHRVYFIGRKPGEIVKCPVDAIPNEWQPVWAISIHGRGKGVPIYCGTSLPNDQPGMVQLTDQRRCRLWKEVLWYQRKRISLPSHPKLYSLWKKYREAARSVR